MTYIVNKDYIISERVRDLANRFQKDEIFYDIGAADKLYVYYRDTKIILCNVVLNVSNKWVVQLIYPFDCVADPRIFESMVDVCSYITVMFRNTVCNAKYLEFIGMTPGTPAIARKLSEELDDKLRESVRWAYAPSDKSITVMHPNGKVVCTIKPDVVKNYMHWQYGVEFYMPFECPLRHRWKDGGYYSDHPNNVVKIITESINLYQEGETKMSGNHILLSKFHDVCENNKYQHNIIVTQYINDDTTNYFAVYAHENGARGAKLAEVYGSYNIITGKVAFEEKIVIADYISNNLWTYVGKDATIDAMKRIIAIKKRYGDASQASTVAPTAPTMVIPAPEPKDRKHNLLARAYKTLKDKNFGSQVSMFINNDSGNSNIKYITVRCDGTIICELIGMFDTNNHPEVVLCCNYRVVGGSSWITESVEEIVTFVTNVVRDYEVDFRKKIEGEAAEDEVRIEINTDFIDRSALLMMARGNGKTNYYTQLWKKLCNGVKIKDVIFQDPATVVFWEDGTKTVVRAQNEAYDPEKGLAMAISKKVLGNDREYYKPFLKWIGKYNKQLARKAKEEEKKKNAPNVITKDGVRYVKCEDESINKIIKPYCDIIIKKPEDDGKTIKEVADELDMPDVEVRPLSKEDSDNEV